MARQATSGATWRKDRAITPDAAIWRAAGILSGMLAWTQGYRREQRRRVLNDALLFEAARQHGCKVLTRNVVDLDLLQQLDPWGGTSCSTQSPGKHHLLPRDQANGCFLVDHLPFPVPQSGH